MEKRSRKAGVGHCLRPFETQEREALPPLPPNNGWSSVPSLRSYTSSLHWSQFGSTELQIGSPSTWVLQNRGTKRVPLPTCLYWMLFLKNHSEGELTHTIRGTQQEPPSFRWVPNRGCVLTVPSSFRHPLGKCKPLLFGTTLHSGNPSSSFPAWGSESRRVH